MIWRRCGLCNDDDRCERCIAHHQSCGRGSPVASAGIVWLHPRAALGVLTESKARGLILEVKPLLNLMVRKAGFRITDSLYRRVLQSVGEA
jgi:hypothetical protein